MGLDMSLTVTKFINGYSHAGADSKAEFEAVAAAVGIDATPESPYFQVEIPLAYWRKANAIHRWFVQNCQGGVDECQKANVEREQLEELRDLCSQIMDEPARAEELLPTTDGFFFGGTEYDESYYYDIRDTYDKLTRILADARVTGLTFVYQSSW